MSSSRDEWPCKPGLRIGDLNVNHAHNNLSEISTILENSGKSFHIFGLSKSTLTNGISDAELNIHGYFVMGRDPVHHKKQVS